MIEIRRPDEADMAAVFRLDSRMFAYTMTPEEEQHQRSVMDLDRFRIVLDGPTLVGVAGSYALDMTVPGGASLPTGGVTFVAVAVTHRRRGLLTRLMEEIHADSDQRGEPLVALTASEGGIYERFGYGVATRRRITVIDRRRAQLDARFVPEKPVLRMVEHDDPTLVDELHARWQRVRRLRAGEIDRSPAWIAAHIGDRKAEATWLLHDDGFACWKLEARWDEGHPAHQVELLDLAAATPEAHAALWHAALCVDLAGPVRARLMALDDPLPYLLTDQRALRTVELNDMLWVLPSDVAACFAARTYGSDDELVVETEGTRWRIGGGGCTRVRTRPDLVAERSALGPLLLGVAPTTLAAGRRLTARTGEVLHRADLLFTAFPGPHSMTGF